MIDQLTDAFFAEREGRTFVVHLGDDAATLVLLECRRLGSPHRTEGRAPFSLLFRGARELRLPQGTYALETEGTAELPLFLVPLAPDPEGTIYEAVFT